MKRSLMTASELKKRYKPSKALNLSIEKWERLGFRENWESICDAHKVEFIDGDTCGLCYKYEDKHRCSECPLPDCNKGHTQWHEARDAIGTHDRPAFMKARNNLLKRMKRAKARGEK